ncbi:MAG: IS110 family transposase [Erysipelotrichaceae bacterium]|nr:IS110 family transposase [Erysipelotrichaceae bacterium]
MTYFIGLDLAKFKHDCFIMNEHGEVVRNPFSFSNDQTGFNTLLNVLNSLDPSQKKRIGLEATGHYGSNLKIFLEENDFSFMEFNPILISRFSKATTLRRTKTDKIDAHLIALYVSSVDYKPYPVKSYHIRNLKSLCRARDSLVKERSLQLVRMTNVLDLIFPEFKPFFGGSLKSSTAIYLLENYCVPSKIARMTVDSYRKMASALRRTISYARFIELKLLAKNTVGNEDPILSFQLSMYLELFKELDSKITDIDTLIIDIYKDVDSHIHTVPGIGTVTAAGIFSEIGNISRFSNADQLVAFAGMDSSRAQSGETDYSGHMVKHGSSYLRQYLMNAAEMQLIHNPLLYEYYLKKRNEGKVHRVALSHVARRLVRIIFSLEKHNSDFDFDKMR